MSTIQGAVYSHRSHSNNHPKNKKTQTMKSITNKLRTLALAAGTLAFTATGASAAPDPSYQAGDLVMFFRNPNGSVGTDQSLAFSLGSTTDVFRRAATPGDATFGTVISLGNINAGLTTAYGANWTTLSSNIFVGAAGNGPGPSDNESQLVVNGDYSRTVYITSPRTGAGTYGQRNSSNRNVSSGSSASSIIAGNIDGANSILLASTDNPQQLSNFTGLYDDFNPISALNVPGSAFGGISGGVIGPVSSSSYSFGSITGVVRGLDLYRITPNTNNVGTDIAWQNENDIARTYGGGSSGSAYYLGTLTLSDNGDVNFAAVPEPSTYALLALAAAGLGAHVLRRRQKQS
jgi:hypothetical protein